MSSGTANDAKNGAVIGFSPRVATEGGRRLRLNTAQNARKSLARVVREFYADDEADVQRFRALTYAISVLISALRDEQGDDFIARVGALEKILAERPVGGR